MNGLLVDNWSLEKALSCYQDRSKTSVQYSMELVALVEALVLWDDVYYWDNGRTFWNEINCSLPKGLNSFLHPLKAPYLLGDDLVSISEECYKSSLVADTSIKYLRLADQFSLAYLPVDKRAQFILENDLYAKFSQVYSRSEIFEGVDKDVQSYYYSINEEIRKANITFTPHCLFQFVVANCNEDTTIFEVAREIGCDRTVRTFKKWVSAIEDRIACGKYIEIYRIREELRSIESDLIMNHSKIEFDASVGVPLAFSVNLSIPFSKHHPELVFPVSVFKKTIGID